MLTAGVVRTLLFVDMAVMALFALIYLRQRRLTWMEYLGWGLLALGVPVLGPFLVISRRPGKWDPDYSFKEDLRRLVTWARRLLPEPPPKMSRLDRARLRRKLRQRK